MGTKSKKKSNLQKKKFNKKKYHKKNKLKNFLQQNKKKFSQK